MLRFYMPLLTLKFISEATNDFVRVVELYLEMPLTISFADVIDFARVFPPTAEDHSVGKTFLYNLMRPEFVRRYKEPLSSDAFSGFTKGKSVVIDIPFGGVSNILCL